MRVLVTGANGFVGSAVCERLAREGHAVIAAVRRPEAIVGSAALRVVTGEIDGATTWERALDGVTAVVHLAARVHRIGERDAAKYHLTNAEGTANLAAQAAAAGVRRFVFVSTVKVNGESRAAAYSERDATNPSDAYSRSKLEAERRVLEIAGSAGMDAVIIRPPLVYGPGVSANFLRLLHAVYRDVPLPFARVRNRRSLVYVGNLADALERAVQHPRASGRVFFVSDGDDLSTPELIARLATHLKRRPRLWPVPMTALRVGGALAGRSETVDRLIGSLSVDIGAVRRELDWTPPVAVDEALRRTTEWYLASYGR